MGSWLFAQRETQPGTRHRSTTGRRFETETSHKAITVTEPMIEALKTWKQTAQFCAQVDWIFASPAQLGRLPWSADSVNDPYMKAAPAAGIAHVSTHTMRHPYQPCLYATRHPIPSPQT